MARPVALWSQSSDTVSVLFEGGPVTAEVDSSSVATFGGAAFAAPLAVALFGQVERDSVDASCVESVSGMSTLVTFAKAVHEEWPRLTSVAHAAAPMVIRCDWDRWQVEDEED